MVKCSEARGGTERETAGAPGAPNPRNPPEVLASAEMLVCSVRLQEFVRNLARIIARRDHRDAKAAKD